MEYYYWIGLKAVPGIGNVAFRRLLERFDTPKAVFEASAEQLFHVKGISKAIVDSIKSGSWKRFAEEESRRLELTGINLITFTSSDYPKSLFEIPDPPPFMYIKGKIYSRELSLAVVGSRRATSYGLITTRRIAKELAVRGVSIISGMARGVDTAAHIGALEAAGRTVGVLGCGVDKIYPPENLKLFEEISEKGCLLSEFPLGTLPLAENFPRRNRIISGLSSGVLVVEAAEKSGSLITAQFALEHGRDVFAVPGNIGSNAYKGSNSLIKQGAKLVDCVEDILDELPGFSATADNNYTIEKEHSSPFSLTPKEALVYELLARAALHIDDIIKQTELTAGEVSSMLLHLELKGAITPLPGKHFAVSR